MLLEMQKLHQMVVINMVIPTNPTSVGYGHILSNKLRSLTLALNLTSFDFLLLVYKRDFYTKEQMNVLDSFANRTRIKFLVINMETSKMKLLFLPDSFVNFCLSSPTLVFAIIIRLKKLLSERMAAFFQPQPDKEYRYRRIAAGGRFSFLGISFAGCFEWQSREQSERSKRNRLRRVHRQ